MGNSKSRAKARRAEEERASANHLYYAVKYNSLSTLQELFANDRVLNINGDVCSDKKTVLFKARSAAAAALLLENGADVHVRSSKGKTPLFSAAKTGDAAFVRLLLERGADVHARRTCGDTALHVVTSGEAARLLLAHGADANATDEAGRSPLFSAVGLRDPSVAEALIAAGADATLLTTSGESVMFAVTKATQILTLALLVEHRAPVNITSKMTRTTPLHAAVQIGSAEIVRFMLEHGAPLDTKALTSRVPLCYALSNGHAEVIRELVAWRARSAASKELNASPMAPVWNVATKHLIAKDYAAAQSAWVREKWVRRLRELCPVLHDAKSAGERLTKHLEIVNDKIRTRNIQDNSKSAGAFALVVLHVWTWMLEYKALSTVQWLLYSPQRRCEELTQLHKAINMYEGAFAPIDGVHYCYTGWEGHLGCDWSVRLQTNPGARKDIQAFVTAELAQCTAGEALRPQAFWERIHAVGLGLEILRAQEPRYGAFFAFEWSNYPELAPPESRSGQVPESCQSDVYLLGIHILHALTRGDPWKHVSGDVARVLKRAARLPLKPESVSREQWQLIEAMCAVDPKKRLELAQVAAKLRELAQEEVSEL